MNVWTAYRALTPEQKHALRDKRLELNRDAASLLEFLKPLAACDELADSSRKRLGCSFGIGIALTIALMVVFSNMGWPAPAAIPMLVVVAGMIAAGYFWLWTRKIDLSNNFRQFMLPVLTVLRDDFDPTQQIHVRLDLASPTAKEKKQSQSDPYPSGRYYKVVDSIYLDDWMSVDAVLVDGTKLSWRVVDSIRERRKTKKNPRGKIKTKTKYLKKTEVEVRMALRKKTYALPQAAGGEPGDAKRNIVKTSREVRTESLDPVDPRALLDLIADVFRSTGSARESA
jgi:hypothetical protein